MDLTVDRGCRSAGSSSENIAVKRLMVFSALLLVGCVTKDFKVVDALKVGMSPAEAQAAIRSYGFSLAKSLSRPADGWPVERTTIDAAGWRAGREEAHMGKRVLLVEFYPVGHGLFGAGQLFLFYGEDARLVDFYRYQIN